MAFLSKSKYAKLIPYKESALHVESDFKTNFGNFLSEEANWSQNMVYNYNFWNILKKYFYLKDIYLHYIESKIYKNWAKIVCFASIFWIFFQNRDFLEIWPEILKWPYLGCWYWYQSDLEMLFCPFSVLARWLPNRHLKSFHNFFLPFQVVLVA